MDKIRKLIGEMRANPKGVRFTDLCKVCDACFGKPRIRGSSHRVYQTPWQGDPSQNLKGMAKPCQVRQVLASIDLLETDNDKRN